MGLLFLLLDKGAFGMVGASVFEKACYSGKGIISYSKRLEAVLTIKSRKGRQCFQNQLFGT